MEFDDYWIGMYLCCMEQFGNKCQFVQYYGGLLQEVNIFYIIYMVFIVFLYMDFSVVVSVCCVMKDR